MTRLLRIVAEALRLLGWMMLAWLGVRGTEEGPRRVRRSLERLGTTFIKVGQGLSVRRDLLPDDYVAELQRLQDEIPPFPAAVARQEIELAFGRPVGAIFSSFDDEAIAAASIAQVHRAKLPDGRDVIVKIRRPGVARQIRRDLNAIGLVLRIASAATPRLARHRPDALLRELATNIARELDFRHEARNIGRFAGAFAGSAEIYVPGAVPDLVADTVIVQEMGHGCRIDDATALAEGPRLARVLVDAFLKQIFELGVFHGDPHPGNLFLNPDGRVCLHDFGLVGTLDRAKRRHLAGFTLAFVEQDPDWLLQAAVDLGVIGGEFDRAEFRRGLAEIIADYAELPISDWSLAEAFLRVTRLGRGENVIVPHDLLVLVRALFLLESVLRRLDPELKLIESLVERGRSVVEACLSEAPPAAASRLVYEAKGAALELPAGIADALHRLPLAIGDGLPVSLRHRNLEGLEAHIDKAANRLSFALVALGLYVAGSLLMQHSIGPRIAGELPAAAAFAYALALWFTFRLARGIARSGRL